MVGIVIVSHSKKLAEGVVEISKMMAANVPIVAAGGLEDGSLGTSYEKICAAIEEVYSADGVIILPDMGSAVLTTEMVLEDLDRDNIRIIDCPLIEGAVIVSVESAKGSSLEEISEYLKTSLPLKKFSL